MTLKELLKIILVIIGVMIGANFLIRGCTHFCLNGLVLARKAAYEAAQPKHTDKGKPDAASEQNKAKQNSNPGTVKTVPTGL